MRKFKTESKKLLDLMINSIYTNREIFLRELVSNASDAIDKLYLKSLTDSSVQVDQASLAINVAFDKDARTITVSDNGIGMTAEELERNLGTIAHSGSEEFKAANAESPGRRRGHHRPASAWASTPPSWWRARRSTRDQPRVRLGRGLAAGASDGVEGYTIEPVSADDPRRPQRARHSVIMAPARTNAEEAELQPSSSASGSSASSYGSTATTSATPCR